MGGWQGEAFRDKAQNSSCLPLIVASIPGH
jgi:hypothetical protein